MANKPDEPWARRRLLGLPVAGFWIGSSGDTVYLRPRTFSKDEEVTFVKHALSFTPPSERNEQVTEEGDCNDGNYTWTQSWTVYFNDRDDILLWFPLGAERCLAVYAETGINYSFSGTTTISEQWSRVEGQTCDLETPGQLKTVYAQNRSKTLSKNYSVASSPGYNTVKAWVVSNTKIKQIIPTQALQEYMLQFLLRYDLATASTFGDSGYNVNEQYDSDPFLGNEEDEAFPCTDPPNQEEADYYYPSTTISPEVGTETVTCTPLEAEVGTDQFGNPACIKVGGFISSTTQSYTGVGGGIGASTGSIDPAKDYYGVDRDRITYLGCYNVFIRGPGATYILKNPDTVTSPGQSPSSIKEEFFDQVPIPKTSLGLEYQSTNNVTTSFRFDIISALFYPGYTQIPGKRENPQSRIGYPYNDEDFQNYNFTFNACWDWGLSSYCIYQFFLMGFDVQDLLS